MLLTTMFRGSPFLTQLWDGGPALVYERLFRPDVPSHTDRGGADNGLAALTGETQADLAIDEFSFSPAPVDSKDMSTSEYGAWTDHYFEPVDDMEVIIKVRNKGSGTPDSAFLKVTLYATDSGDLPKAEPRDQVSRQEVELPDIDPGMIRATRLKFSGLSRYHQSHRLLYSVNLKVSGDAALADNEAHRYFLMLVGE